MRKTLLWKEYSVAEVIVSRIFEGLGPCPTSLPRCMDGLEPQFLYPQHKGVRTEMQASS